MRNYLLFLAIVFSSFAQAQTWNGLTENNDLAGLEENPLKGFVDLFNPSNEFPNSISASLFDLDELMLGMNNFNWTPIHNYLEEEALKGNHSYIQVNIDPADGTTNMPAFLMNQVEWYEFPGDPGNGVPADLCPDWNDPELMAAMVNFIQAFGAEFNNNERVFMVHMGLYGMWGEWHIGSVQPLKPEFEMTETNRSLIAETYVNSFTNKTLIARFPEHMPDPQLFGYSDGLFFTQSISNSQWDYGYFHNTLQSYHSDQNWRFQPIGGEIDPCVQSTIWQTWPNPPSIPGCNGTVQSVEESMSLIHPTWLFSHHIFTDLPENSTEWDNAITAQKMMGYTFYVNQYRLSASNGFPTVEVNIQNTGLAPMYANWDVEIGVLNSADEFQLLDVTKWDINLIQPAVLENYRSLTSGASLGDGTYTFLLRIKNPLSVNYPNAKQVTFANNTQDQDRQGWLTLGEMTITGGDSGTVPTKVSNLTVSPSTVTMTVGDVLPLSGIVSPSNATNPTITWYSGSPGTVSVDANGEITAGPAYGDATVFAYTQDGAFLGESQITVEPLRVTIPAMIEAEDFIRMTGIAVLGINNNNSKIGFVDKGDWMEYGVVVTEDANFILNVNAASDSGSEIALVDEAGVTLAIIPVANSGSNNNFQINSSDVIPLTAGNYNLKILAEESNFDLDWIEFVFDSPLPIELLDFSASPNKEKILLEWTTLTETNNKGFYLERGTNRNDFVRIEWIDGKGTTTEAVKYDFVDSAIEFNKDYYYRLAQQDFDGTTTYSKVVTARLNNSIAHLTNALTVFPNPTNNSVTLDWNSDDLNFSIQRLSVLNVFGAQVSPVIINNKTIDLSTLPSGVYFLEMEVGGERITKRIIKN